MALRDKLREVVSIQDSPRKVALSFAVGVFLGMSPLLGLHTVLGIAAALIFRLNKFVTILGVYITNPWTIVPLYTFSTWLGAKMLGVEEIIPAIDWDGITFSYFLKEMKHLLWPFLFGTTFVGILSAALGYVVIHHAIMKSRSRKEAP
ncbi:MAG: DUF2062 domain-containing protein [Alphaproteobacteria bacterium]|uniref:DUF2062 domain-containing protein n=1 Tax=Candidatus Nitrobium versatile TaxID=2884831 RepID=A0A953J8C9_9BACT|nr:DUF2062 domain-containing protein [Candidatus Nitrobium versatile]